MLSREKTGRRRSAARRRASVVLPAPGRPFTMINRGLNCRSGMERAPFSRSHEPVTYKKRPLPASGRGRGRGLSRLPCWIARRLRIRDARGWRAASRRAGGWDAPWRLRRGRAGSRGWQLRFFALARFWQAGVILIGRVAHALPVVVRAHLVALGAPLVADAMAVIVPHPAAKDAEEREDHPPRPAVRDDHNDDEDRRHRHNAGDGHRGIHPGQRAALLRLLSHDLLALALYLRARLLLRGASLRI